MPKKSKDLKRLIVVEEDEFENGRNMRGGSAPLKDITKELRDYNPQLNSLARLRKRMDDILEDPDDSNPVAKLMKLHAIQSQFLSGLAEMKNPSAHTQSMTSQVADKNEINSEANIDTSPFEHQRSSSPIRSHTEEMTEFRKSLPQQYHNKFEKFYANVLSPNRSSISKDSRTGELIINGNQIEGSSYDDLIRDFYVPSRGLNVTGQEELINKLSELGTSTKNKARSFISNANIIRRLGTPKFSTSSAAQHMSEEFLSPNTSDYFVTEPKTPIKYTKFSRPPGSPPNVIKIYP